MIRRPIITLLGHVNHGKSSILDKIRGTNVVSREAGGITQTIGCSLVPLRTIQSICGPLLNVIKSQLTLPGLLFIDSPGHAAFTTLRKRGGSLADIAILVVDINEGFKPQTLESIEILKANKVPFIVAANKIDLINGWNYDPEKYLLDNIANLDFKLQSLFETKIYELVAKFAELGLESERFDRVQDYTKQLAIVPISAKSGEGIPELLMVLTGLAQKFLEKKLEIEEEGNAKGTVLEVKEEQGLGTTLNAILYNGTLKVNDTIIIGGIDGAITAKVRALLEPAELAEMREKKAKFQNVKEAVAATGVKISAPGLEKAIAGMPLRSCSGRPEEIELLKAEVQLEVSEVVVECDECIGILIKSDTIGGLEALRNLLLSREIPVASASLGDITKKDLSQLESLRDKDEFVGVILGFNVNIPADLEEYIKAKKFKIITNNVIYKTIEEYEVYIQNLKKEIELRELSKIVRPCKFLFLKGYVFRQNNPAIIGVEIEIGQIKSGDPVMNGEGKALTTVKSMEEGQENVSLAAQGKQLAMALDGMTVGRQINEGDFLYTDIPEEDFKKLKELKKHLSKTELEVLREIAEIKRRNNPVWGVG